MSVSTTPLLHRGFFPGATNQAATTTGYDFVNLTSIDGDNGLREAYRIWWLTEQITFTPAGTVTIGAASRSFTKAFRAPDSLDTGLSAICTVSGSIVGNDISGGPVSPKEPAFRSGRVLSGLFLPQLLEYEQVFVYGGNDSESADTGILVLSVSGQWRMYYRLFFRVETRDVSPPTGQLIIVNPSASAVPAVNTGTVSLFGYSLDWKSYTSGTGASSSGAGLSAASVEWTF